MPPSFFFPEFFRSTPEYVKGYSEGFEDAKRACLKRLKAIEKEISDLEAYTNATYTATANLEV